MNGIMGRTFVGLVFISTLLLPQLTHATIEPDWQIGDPQTAVVNPDTGELEIQGGGGDPSGPVAQPENGATETLMIIYIVNVTQLNGGAFNDLTGYTQPYISSLVESGIATAFGSVTLNGDPMVSTTMTMVGTNFYEVSITVYAEFLTLSDAANYKAEFSSSFAFEYAFRAVLNIAITAAMEGRKAVFDADGLIVQYIESTPEARVEGGEGGYTVTSYGHTSNSKSAHRGSSDKKKGKKSKSKHSKVARFSAIQHRFTSTSEQTAAASHQGSSIVLYGVFCYVGVVGAVLFMSHRRVQEQQLNNYEMLS
eukprot:m.33040 g.33040  ORF g.33040 m.33040 type:complete len:309 (-) comp16749_c0_seq1:233-1159(-)